MNSENEEAAPKWLDDFVAAVASAYEIWNPTDKAIGWGWAQEEGANDDAFDVVVYPTLVEVEGKSCLPCNISIDLSSILALFKPWDDISLTYNSDEDYVSISGRVGGHDVWLRLLYSPPEEDAAPAARVHPGGRFEEIEPGPEERSR
jgi:hypothetical protein